MSPKKNRIRPVAAADHDIVGFKVAVLKRQCLPHGEDFENPHRASKRLVERRWRLVDDLAHPEAALALARPYRSEDA